MTKVYTNYWHSRRDNVVKEHGSYATEEEALEGIQTWWELHGETYNQNEPRRTNSGALEINYLADDNYYYRIESRDIQGNLPSPKPQKRPMGQVEKIRKELKLGQEEFLYEELAEPYQDRLIKVMNDGKILLAYTYDEKGRPIQKYNK